MNRRVLFAMVAPLLIGSSLPATEQGRITGRVVDGSGAPLPDVQIYLVGDAIGSMSLGSLSRTTGTFTIPTVPIGAYELRAERIGFGSDRRAVIVEEGAELVVNFQLRETAVGLNEIVSNGAASAPAPIDTRSDAPRAAAAPRPTGLPAFTPMTVKPELINLAEVRQAMVAAYPSEMRASGTRGTVMIRLYLSAAGEVERQIVTSVEPAGLASEAALIQAARSAASVARFSSAFNYDQRVPVWVQFPMTFRP